ncbi:MAG: hypothetical protein MJ178_06800 [Treponemataceae bacterium]|nr:hypothetical protein [Treponemataceae bacterium]
MASTKKSIGLVVTQVAMAILLVIMGIMTLQLNSSGSSSTLSNLVNSARASVSGNEIASAVYSLLGVKSPLAAPIIIVLGICELLGGVFLCVNLIINTGKLENLFLVIILVMWCVVIVLVDILGKSTGFASVNWQKASDILAYLKDLASHLLVLGALLQVMKKD